MLTVNNGLSQGMIFDMLQSKDGFPWIATKDGLNRYDGARFEVFSPDPFDPFAIGNSEVQRLFEDSRGWIWVMLPVGLDVFDPEDSGRFFHVKHEGKPIRTGSIAETPDGVIWIPERERILKISLQKDLLAKAAKQGKADIEPTCKAILLSNVSDWSGEPLQALFLHFTKEKKLLASTNHGLFRLDSATEQIVPELPNTDLYTIDWLSECKTGEVLIRGKQADGSILWALLLGEKALENVPDLIVSDAMMPLKDGFLQKARGIIDAHYSEEDFGLPQLCQKIGMSRSQLFRKMKALTDIAPSDLIRTHRLNKAKTLLESGAANVAEAAWQVGFKYPFCFPKLYQEEFGEVLNASR